MNAYPQSRPQLRHRTAPLVIAALWLASCFSLPAAETPFYIPFQGKITDPTGQSVADGTYDLIFSLYDVRVGGQPLWTERHAQVGAVDGHINVFLGSIPDNPVPLRSLDFATEKWLGITVDTDASAQPEMVPRQLLTPAFYALRAKDADQLQGHDWSVLFADGDPTGSISGDRIAAGSIGNTQLAPGLVSSQLRAEGVEMQLSSAPLSATMQELGYVREPGYLDVSGNHFYAYRLDPEPVYRFALVPPLGSELMENQSLDFGALSELILTLRNLGNRELTSLNASIDGENAADFSASIQDASVPIAGTTTILLTFTPSHFGQSNAVLHVSANGIADPFNLYLQGAGGTAPEGFAVIPAGEFTMGRINEDMDSDAPPITVTISTFAIQKEEVSGQQWQQVYAWAMDNGYDMSPPYFKDDIHPVSRISWFDAVKWCNARSEMEGLTPCYYTDAAQSQTYKSGNVDITNEMVKWDANGYRLPTEAEWEKAARGGASGTRFSWGPDLGWHDWDWISHDAANYNAIHDPQFSVFYDHSMGTGFNWLYNDGIEPYTNPVGDFADSANGYGLKNMSGNVREWCWDWYNPGYYITSANTTDPRGPASGSVRVLRGGDWKSSAARARCSAREYRPPGMLSAHPALFAEGFRPVRARP